MRNLIDEAPEPFRERLLALKKAGVLDDPYFMRSLKDAVEEVVAEEKARRAKGECPESSPEITIPDEAVSEGSEQDSKGGSDAQKH